MIDAEKRKGGKETGLDTQLLLPVNDEWWLLVTNYLSKIFNNRKSVVTK